MAAAFNRVESDLQLEIGETGALLESSQLQGLALANPPLLHVILRNLASNALKFVAPGVVPRIELWSERREKVVRLCVRDTWHLFVKRLSAWVAVLAWSLNPGTEACFGWISRLLPRTETTAWKVLPGRR